MKFLRHLTDRRSPFLAFIAGGFAVLACLILGAAPALAQQVDVGLQYGTSFGLATTDVRVIIGRIVSYFLGLLGVIAVGIVIYAGFLWMTARGNEEQVQKAKRTLISAVIGLIIIMSAYAITVFVMNAIIGGLTGGGAGQACPGGNCGPSGCSGGFCPLCSGSSCNSYLHVESVTPSGARRGVGSANVGKAYGYPKNSRIDTLFYTPAHALKQETITAGSVKVFKCNPSFADDATADKLYPLTAFDRASCQETGGPGPVAGSVNAAGPTQVRFVNGTANGEFDGNYWYLIRYDSSIQDTRTTDNSLACPPDSASPPIQLPQDVISADRSPSPLYCERAVAFNDRVDNQAPNIDNVWTDSTCSAEEKITFHVHATDDSTVQRIDFQLDTATDTIHAIPDSKGYATAQFSIQGVNPGNHTLHVFAYDSVQFGSRDFNFFLQATHCCNGVKDDAETAPDCGGPECNSCQHGPPKITDVVPGTAGPGSIITVKGEWFGAEPGSIVFLGDKDSSTDDVTATACSPSGWTQQGNGYSEARVAVPASALTGPLKLVTANGQSDRTDVTAPILNDFIVDPAKTYPGICYVDPDQGIVGSKFTVNGAGFGASKNDLTLNFGSSLSSLDSGTALSDTTFKAIVPTLTESIYELTVQLPEHSTGVACTTNADCSQGDTCKGTPSTCWTLPISNPASFTVQPPGEENNPVISEIIPSEAPVGSYITIRGTGFGSTMGTVKLFKASVTPATPDSTANADLPPAYCPNSWSDKTIVVKVPANYVGTDPENTSGPTIAHGGSAGDHNIVVRTGGTGVARDSAPVKFRILDGTPGPGICSVEPSAGPAGTQVVFKGERFGGGPKQTDVASPIYAADFFLSKKFVCSKNSSIVCNVADCNRLGVDAYCASLSPSIGSCCADGACRANCADTTPQCANNGFCRPDADTALTYSGWGNTQVGASVPANAKSGPVYLVANDLLSSNAAPFVVANCKKSGGDQFCKDNVGSAAPKCCDDGTCQAATGCQPVFKRNAFGWKFSTELLPALPIVVERPLCAIGQNQSPSPYKGSTDACKNVVVYMEFNRPMDTATFTPQGTVILEKCGNASVPDCPSTPSLVNLGATPLTFEDLSVNSQILHNAAMSIHPSDQLSPKYWYRVTLKSSVVKETSGVLTRSGITDFRGAGAVNANLDGDMDGKEGGDYVYSFRVRDSNDSCALSSVSVNPVYKKYTQQFETADFAASLLGSNCNHLSCSTTDNSLPPVTTNYYYMRWALTPPTWSNFLTDMTSTGNPPREGACLTKINFKGTRETINGSIDLTASATTNPPATTPLYKTSSPTTIDVNFTDPAVTASKPKCLAACINSQISATFNIPINVNTIFKTGVGIKNVHVYKCRNANCTEPYVADLPLKAVGLDDNMAVDPAVPDSVLTLSLDNETNPPTALEANTYYIVKLLAGPSDNAIRSQSDVKLTGANEVSGPTAYYAWKFKTRESTAPCAPFATTVEPQNVNVTAADQRIQLSATALGAPDECDPNGQSLDPWSFDWIWSTSVTDDKYGTEGIVKGFYPDTTQHPNVSSAKFNRIAAVGAPGCNDKCLNTGSQVVAPQCGNGILEKGEDCDMTAGDWPPGCDHLTCRLLGAGPVPGGTCGNGAVDSGEQCDMIRDASTDQLVWVPGCKKPGCVRSGSSGSLPTGCGTANTADITVRPELGGDNAGTGCVLLGAAIGGSVCGDAIVADGEVCDDGNKASGDGCSSDCLNEGTVPSCASGDLASPDPGKNCNYFCGNGIEEPGEDTGCDGFFCNDTQRKSCNGYDDRSTCGVGVKCLAGVSKLCNQSTCVKIGSHRCISNGEHQCCGDGTVDPDEQCDGEAGCSPDTCLLLGSSAVYDTAPSFCRDGLLGAGEDAKCDGKFCRDDKLKPCNARWQCASGVTCDATAPATNVNRAPLQTAVTKVPSSPVGDPAIEKIYAKTVEVDDSRKGAATLSMKKTTTAVDVGPYVPEAACVPGSGILSNPSPARDIVYACAGKTILVKFSQPMDPGTFVADTTVKLLKCSGTDSCSQPTESLIAAAALVDDADEQTLEITLKADMAPGMYEIDLFSGDTGIKGKDGRMLNGDHDENVGGNFRSRFTVCDIGTSNECKTACAVSGADVLPSSYVLRQTGTNLPQGGFRAAPVSASCQVLGCDSSRVSQIIWAWPSPTGPGDWNSKLPTPLPVETAQPYCHATVKTSGMPSVATNNLNMRLYSAASPTTYFTNDASVTVNLTGGPRVVEAPCAAGYSNPMPPNGAKNACPSPTVKVLFDRQLKASSFQNGNIAVQECLDDGNGDIGATCGPIVANGVWTNIGADPVQTQLEITLRNSANNADYSTVSGKWYRLQLSRNITDLDNLRLEGNNASGDYVATFKVQNDDTVCALASVAVIPKSAFVQNGGTCSNDPQKTCQKDDFCGGGTCQPNTRFSPGATEYFVANPATNSCTPVPCCDNVSNQSACAASQKAFVTWGWKTGTQTGFSIQTAAAPNQCYRRTEMTAAPPVPNPGDLVATAVKGKTVSSLDTGDVLITYQACSQEQMEYCQSLGLNCSNDDGLCYEPPAVSTTYPVPPNTLVCRNTAVSVTFDRSIKDDASNKQRFHLVREVSSSAGPCNKDGENNAAAKQFAALGAQSHFAAGRSADDQGILARMWEFLRSLFAPDIAKAGSGPWYCEVATTVTITGNVADIAISSALAADSSYDIVAEGDASTNGGVQELHGVELPETYIVGFRTGSAICSVNSVVMDPESLLLKTADQLGILHMYAVSDTGQKLVSTSSLSWTWNWDLPPADTPVSLTPRLMRVANVAYVAPVADLKPTSSSKQGQIMVRGFAHISTTVSGVTTTNDLDARSQVTVFYCNNPWPTARRCGPSSSGAEWPWDPSDAVTCALDKVCEKSSTISCGTDPDCTVNGTNYGKCVYNTIWKPFSDSFSNTGEEVFVCDNDMSRHCSTLRSPALPGECQGSGNCVRNLSTNTSFYYCRDLQRSGDAATTLLPEINDSRVVSLVPGLGILKEYLFSYFPGQCSLNPDLGCSSDARCVAEQAGLCLTKVQPWSNDVIGYRIIGNPSHRRISEWFSGQFGSGSTPSELVVDGYPALKEGRTVYVGVVSKSSVKSSNLFPLYTNVNVLSYSDKAAPETTSIFGQITNLIDVNANLTDTDTCISDTGAQTYGGYCSTDTKVSCYEDSDCGVTKTDFDETFDGTQLPAGWNALTGTWSVGSGKLTGIGVGATAARLEIPLLYRDYRVDLQVSAAATGFSRSGTLFVRYTKSSDSYYVFSAGSSPLVIGRWANNVHKTPDKTVTVASVDWNQSYKMSVEVKGGHLKFLLNDAVQYETDVTEQALFSGSIGLQVANAKVSFDEIKVTDLGNCMRQPTSMPGICQGNPAFICSDEKDCVDGDGKNVGPCFRGTAIGCTSDLECQKNISGVYVPGRVNYYCDVIKSKLIRDLGRWGDMLDMRASFLQRGTYPKLETGTYMRATSNSAWPSWAGVLGQQAGFTLKTDPLNLHGYCAPTSTYKPNSVTCWDDKAGIYTCPAHSHVYGYVGVGGVDFSLQSNLETNCATFKSQGTCNGQRGICGWASNACVPLVVWGGNNCIERHAQSDCRDSDGCIWLTGGAEGSNCQFKIGKLVMGGVNAGTSVCSGAQVGAGSVCGDGIINAAAGEECEPAQTPKVEPCTITVADGKCRFQQTTACTTNANCITGNGIDNGPCDHVVGSNIRSGTQSTACTSSCKWGLPGRCQAGSCGDGVIQLPEICDDGPQNGNYGYCNTSCSAKGQACGDTTRQASEKCECGANNAVYHFNGILQPTGSSCLGPEAGPSFAPSVPSCSWDCFTAGPRCGDGLVNGANEECDGGTETAKGFCDVASMNFTGTQAPCTSNTDCTTAGEQCGHYCMSGYCDNAGGTGSKIPCGETVDCYPGETCGHMAISDLRMNTRSCNVNDATTAGDDAKTPFTKLQACRWAEWKCTSPGLCGNGTKETGEECDTGSDPDHHGSCVIDAERHYMCRKATCGDGYLRTQGQNPEQCDAGLQNGVACIPEYGKAACSFCESDCTIKVVNAGFCGDGVLQSHDTTPPGPEDCDHSVGLADWACVGNLRTYPSPDPLIIRRDTEFPRSGQNSFFGDYSIGVLMDMTEQPICTDKCKRLCPPGFRLAVNTASTPNSDENSINKDIIVDVTSKPFPTGQPVPMQTLRDNADPDKDNDSVPASYDCRNDGTVQSWNQCILSSTYYADGKMKLDCADTDPAIYGGPNPALEVCDGLDNDCSGVPDDGLMRIYGNVKRQGGNMVGAQVQFLCSGNSNHLIRIINPSGGYYANDQVATDAGGNYDVILDYGYYTTQRAGNSGYSCPAGSTVYVKVTSNALLNTHWTQNYVYQRKPLSDRCVANAGADKSGGSAPLTNDATNRVDFVIDVDADGVPANNLKNVDGTVPYVGDADCNDNQALAYGGPLPHPEECGDGIDNDCNGRIDDVSAAAAPGQPSYSVDGKLRDAIFVGQTIAGAKVVATPAYCTGNGTTVCALDSDCATAGLGTCGSNDTTLQASTTSDSSGNFSLTGIRIPSSTCPVRILVEPYKPTSDFTISGIPASMTNRTTRGYVDYPLPMPTSTATLHMGDVFLIPKLAAGTALWNLTWSGSIGTNYLDLHTWVPTSTAYHVYWSDQGNTDLSVSPYTALTCFHTPESGGGSDCGGFDTAPEPTQTVWSNMPDNGEYRVYVDDYNNVGNNFFNTKACKMYIAWNDNNGDHLQTITPPTSGTGKYWYAFRFKRSGSSGVFTSVNSLTNTNP